jgi:hypothetical protein
MRIFLHLEIFVDSISTFPTLSQSSLDEDELSNSCFDSIDLFEE